MADTNPIPQVLTPDTWTNLGAAPCTLELIGTNRAAYILASSAPSNPADKTRAVHVLDAVVKPIVDVGYTGTVYARAYDDKTATLTVTR